MSVLDKLRAQPTADDLRTRQASHLLEAANAKTTAADRREFARTTDDTEAARKALADARLFDQTFDDESALAASYEAKIAEAVARAEKATLKHRDRRLYGSKAEAEAAAQAQLGEFSRGAVLATIECERGVPEAFADSEVRLVGFDSEIDGSYRVKTATHRLDGGGLRTSLELEMTGH